MFKDDRVRLRHMLDAGREAVGFLGNRPRADLSSDRQLVLALVKAIEIIGEAAYRTAPETQARAVSIPWGDIVGMRHRLVHAYFDIDLDILWKTVHDDLPLLIAALESHLRGEGR
jgi:uncharacterized protein with HEPN domain